LIGIFVSIIAIFQWRGLFKEIFIPYEGRPPSTTGNPIFLAIYLLLLTFLTLSFALKEKKYLKKFLYFLSFLFFLFVIIFITQTRAAILGLAVGFLYFFFFFPFKKRSISLAFKIIIFVLFVFGIYGFYYINTQPLPKFIQENKILLDVIQRILIKNIISDARVSAWKVSWQALKARPILGYGPENFSIGFDKFYDPSLPGIEKGPEGFTAWYDRAHNFIFDISVTAGIPALIIYLLLFGVLFWQLQKVKYTNLHECEHEPTRIVAQGIQATIIAYLVANFFSFDSFSSYLISFLLIGYSLHLISEKRSEERGFKRIRRIYTDILKWQGAIIFLLFILLVWFIWDFNIKPLKINLEIESACRFSEKGLCQKAIEKMEKILPEKSFLDHYLRLEYLDIIAQCVQENREMAFELAKKATEILKENTKIRPYYTRNWLLLGGYTNILIEGGEKNLKDEAISYFEKAKEISPKRQEIPLGLSKTYLLTEEYQKAKESAQECINLNARLGDCWWQMALINVYLGEEEMAKKNMEIAKEKGYQIDSEISLLELAKAYLKREKYQELIKIYQKLIAIKPKNPKYHIALAVFYKESGQIEEAKKEALKILELFPEYKKEAEEFLKTLSK
jgi:O-antigen ligase/tetratricopeptide (TPR) repeat protein